mgnify:CR=1 FL=1
MDLALQQVASRRTEDLVKIHTVTRQISGIETEHLKLVQATQNIRALGTVSFDESRLATIAAYFDGRIEKLYANYLGVKVKKGEHLASIYSPDLYSAQIEYLQSLKGGALQKRLREGARKKLVEMGMSSTQIKTLQRSREARSRLTLFSPVSGTVISKGVTDGDYVKTGQSLLKVADLETLWLILDLYPEEASNLRYGLRAKITVDSHPDQPYDGRISFISPVVDTKKRTVRVRVELRNSHGKIRPGEYARALISIPLGHGKFYYDKDLAGKWISPMHPQHVHDTPGNCPVCGMKMVPAEQFGFAKEPPIHPGVITVPRNAVLTMGHTSAVYIQQGNDSFTIRKVVVGSSTSNGRVHILKGLDPGETIATQGVFLIDSQMQLNGKTSLIDISSPQKTDSKLNQNH